MMRSTCERSSVIQQSDKRKRGGRLHDCVAIKNLFIENHVTTKQNLGGHRIPEPITFSIMTVSQKITEMTLGVQLAATLLLNVCISLTPKNSEILQGWLKAIP